MTQTTKAYLSLGSNIDAEDNLRSAAAALRKRFAAVTLSPAYRMPAIGFEGPEFLNAAAIVDSDLDPFALTDWLRGVEREHGRLRTHVKFSSRTLDIDIVYFDDLILDGDNEGDDTGGAATLQLPRPELRYAFVLKPLSDIAPDFVDPVRQVTLAELWANHPDRNTEFPAVAL
ncbi:MAG: 2-amino-4-hydroxy-6-hydroxymethyldihydropteridine diphosphokinase [Pseudomonadota bacterium]|nr:2-amino-4-hydroxy-6-hydroxymethyldihydropteridine diphosphokinase [Pseudomonadota bacterium]